MTDQEIKQMIVETSILNDLIGIRLNELSAMSMNHKDLEEEIIKSRKSSLSLSKVMDNKLGKTAEAFGDLYDQISEIISETTKNILS